MLFRYVHKSSYLTEEEQKHDVVEQIVPEFDDRRVEETNYSVPETLRLCLSLFWHRVLRLNNKCIPEPNYEYCAFKCEY